MAIERRTAAKQSKIDPITFEVLRNAFDAISAEMGLVIAKTAYSSSINEGRDFNSTIFDAEGNLFSQGDSSLPAFTGLSQVTVTEVIKAIGLDNIQPGDLYLTNDPYTVTTHCNDVHVVQPLFYDGERFGFVSTTGHWNDVGGSQPGSLNCRARECYEEGLRVPPIVIYRDGKFNDDVLTVFWANMRLEWERQGDLNAQIAALKIGEARMLSLVEKYGLGTLRTCMSEMQDYAERLLRSYIRELKDGVYYAEDRIDQDLVTGEPKTIRLTLTIDDDHATFDLSESDDRALCGINGTSAASISAVCIGIKSVFPDVAMNVGIRRAVDIIMKQGSIVWAQRPSAVSGLAATTMECVVACTQLALGQALPEKACGAPFSILNTVYGGYDPRPGFKGQFIHYVWTMGGMGAVANHDGPNVLGSQYSASTQTIPCELQERRVSLLWLRYGLRDDSGGPGKSRGGLGAEQILTMPYTDGTISCIGDRERFGPPGVFDGEPGRTAGLVIDKGTPKERNIGIFAASEPVRKDELIYYWSSGGGGYGKALDRDLDLVLNDVINEYVSLEGARRDYGVVIRELDRRRLSYEIDQEATAALRAKMRQERAR